MTTLTQLPADYIQNPHEVHDMLRAEGPVQEVHMPRGLKVWLVTRYDEAKIALTDPRISKNVQEGGHLFDVHAPANAGAATSTRRCRFTCSTWTHPATPGCASS